MARTKLSSEAASKPTSRPARKPKGKRDAASEVDEQLERYRAMRDFGVTAEPSGKEDDQVATASLHALPFVIQKHAATRLHYDFRLGWRGVLKSWACAKGPSYVVKDRRLAVQVEDHPIEYGGFEGTIPKGQYGGGTVLVWDQGTWEPQAGHEDIDAGLEHGSLKFIMHGEKLKGRWTLVRMGGRAANESKPNWLLIKEHDEFERTAEAPAITDEAPDSVVTGRSLEEIAAAEDHVWQSRASDNAKRPTNRSRLVRSAGKPAPRAQDYSAQLKGVPGEDFPGFVPPMLATLVHQPQPGKNWLHELKLDGYRVQAHIKPAAAGKHTVTLYTRNGLDWTHRMRRVEQALTEFAVGFAILDGEVVVLDEEGKSSFSMLQAAFDEGVKHPLTYFAFDLLHLDGHSLREQPLVRRKALLREVLAASLQSEALVFSDDIEASGTEVLNQACALGAEGIVSKLGSSAYRSGRSKDWIKLKCVHRQEFVIGGFTLPATTAAAAAEGIGALLLGVYDGDRLLYCGRTGTGFSQESSRMLRNKLEPIRQAKPAFAGALPYEARKGAHWTRPELVAEVEFATWTADAMIRHASFQGLREDKAAADIVREDAQSVIKPERPRKASSETAESQREGPPPGPHLVPKPAHSGRKTAAQAEVRLTHPDKIIDTESSLTKRQLADYLAAVAPNMLPHISNRPLSLVRCPNGSTNPCFFQKHTVVGLPREVGSVPVPDKDGGGAVEQYISLDSAGALVSLAQLSVLEFHPWGSRNETLERPDRLIFDLDPDEAIEWPVLAASARAVRSFLNELGLDSFVKTTGGKGLHVVVPLDPDYANAPQWPDSKLFTRGIALAIESSDPKLYLIKMTKAARKGRIFIDYMRNERGSTAVAPYSPRARSGMRVAMPLEWDELDQGRPTYAVADLAQWAERLDHDPWAGMLGLRQRIEPAVLAAVTDAGRKG